MNIYVVFFMLGVRIKYGIFFVSLGSKAAYTGENVSQLFSGQKPNFSHLVYQP